MDETLRQETMTALYEAFNHRDRQVRHVWVMSREWFHEIRSMFSPWGFDPGLTVDAPRTLLGVPIEIRDDAGFPKLVLENEWQIDKPCGCGHLDHPRMGRMEYHCAEHVDDPW